MIPRRILVVLVLALPILVVSVAVLAGASWLAEGVGDKAGALGLRWVAISAMILLAIDSLLLLVVLGINSVQGSDRQ